MTTTSRTPDFPGGLGPREKLALDPGAASLSDAELLAVILNSGSEGCPVVELSQRILEAFPSLEEFVNADWLAMKARIAEWNGKHPGRPIKGVADAKLLRVSAAFRFVGRARGRLSAGEFRKADLRSPAGVSKVFRKTLESSPEKEHFYVLPVDSKIHPLCAPLDVAQGTVSSAPIHPREVFCEAVRYRAFAIVVAHNHPDGDPWPSPDDIEITRRLVATGRTLGIRLLDHLILGTSGPGADAGYVSIRAKHPTLFPSS